MPLYIFRTLILFTALFYLNACMLPTTAKPQAEAQTTPPETETQAERNIDTKAAQNCDSAIELSNQAFDLYQKGLINQAREKLESAIQQCPSNAKNYNNLAELLKEDGNDSQAIVYYRQALALDPNLSDAYHGLGEIYYKQGQFPLSLEAHLHACQTDKDSKKRITALLKENRYTINEKGDIFNKESLLLLYNNQRRQAIDRMISSCGLRGLARMEQPVVTFRGFQFELDKATLLPGSEGQLDEMAATFKALPDRMIKISGHSGNKPFEGLSAEESEKRHIALSKDRAYTLAKALEKRGIPMTRIQVHGYGSKVPLVSDQDPEAWTKNQRVEIQLD